MGFPDGLSPTPWDQRVFGFATWEVLDPAEELLAELAAHPGHYTVKVDPLAPTERLHRHGFYYCDTLLEPYADGDRFRESPHAEVALEPCPAREAMIALCDGTFRHGRFHRDFNIDPRLADQRYNQWVGQLCDEGNAFALLYRGETAAFFGYRGNKLVLHAVAPAFQGRGLAKFLWSRACRELFDRGHLELCSSVSASNLAIVNLYASLGFRFRNPIDIYHRLVP